MSTERLIVVDKKMQYSDHTANHLLPRSCSSSVQCAAAAEQPRIFEELPKATIVSVSRPDTSDISPMLLCYNIEFHYKQFKWRLVKKASQVLYLHFAVKKRVIIDEFQEKQEQVKEWLHSLGIVDQVAVVQDDDEPDDGAVPLHHKGSGKNSNVPSRAVLPILRPALGRQQSVSDRAKVEMQCYLNHFLGNIDIVNSREVCKFLEVSRLSFAQKYGPKLKEGYVMVKHLSKISRDVTDAKRCTGCCFGCCNNSWQKVWSVLKPGFLALLEDPFNTKLLDIIVFDVLPTVNGNGGSGVHLANQIKESNPLRYAFKVSCGNRSTKFRSTGKGKVKDWVAAINDAGLRPLEGWCHPYRFGSFAPPRGLDKDGSQAQCFIDSQAAFEAIASSIEDAKSEIFITGWWLCPELYLRRPFENHPSSRLDALLESKAKQGVQIYILLYKEVALALKINSQYSMKRLRRIHENVKVLRYPDHLATGVYLWSHHEKLVIIDYRICYIGGLDLCFGRYDTVDHRVGDCPPNIWPGKDYYNPRESEPNSWEDTMKDELDREKYPRMPWHDVHCALWGPPCRDVARHFVQRWNHAKRSKAPNEQAIPLLIPYHHMVLPHYMGRSQEIDIVSKKTEQNRKDLSIQDSFSSQSPPEDIPLLLPQESDKLVESDTDHKLNGLNTKHNHRGKPSGVGGYCMLSTQKYKAEALVPDMQLTGLVDGIESMDLQNEENLNLEESFSPKMSDEWWESSEEDNYGEIGPRMACSCQDIRSVGQWSTGTSQTEDSIHRAYCSLIENAEHFIYIEVFQEMKLYRTAYWKHYIDVFYEHTKNKNVSGSLLSSHSYQASGGVSMMVAQQLLEPIGQFPERTSILHKLNMLLGPKTQDYITLSGLRSFGRLCNGGPVATSQVYVHG